AGSRALTISEDRWRSSFRHSIARLDHAGERGRRIDLQHELQAYVLEHGAATGTSHGERLQHPLRRSNGERNDQRPHAGQFWQYAGADLAWHKTIEVEGRQRTQVD